MAGGSKVAAGFVLLTVLCVWSCPAEVVVQRDDGTGRLSLNGRSVENGTVYPGVGDLVAVASRGPGNMNVLAVDESPLPASGDWSAEIRFTAPWRHDLGFQVSLVSRRPSPEDFGRGDELRAATVLSMAFGEDAVSGSVTGEEGKRRRIDFPGGEPETANDGRDRLILGHDARNKRYVVKLVTSQGSDAVPIPQSDVLETGGPLFLCWGSPDAREGRYWGNRWTVHAYRRSDSLELVGELPLTGRDRTAGGEPVKPPRVAAPEMAMPTAARAPRVNGILEEVEWDGAAAVPLVVDTATGFSATPSTIAFVTRDAAHLYVAFRSPLPAEAAADPTRYLLHGMLRTEVTDRDTAVWDDDSVEVRLVTGYPAGQGTFFRFLVNDAGVRYDERSGDITWNPEWPAASKADLDGWAVELAIPFAVLTAEDVAEGDAWGINFIRHWRKIAQVSTAWMQAAEPGSLGQLVFRPDTAPVQANSLGDLGAGSLDAVVRVANPSLKPIAGEVLVRVDSGEVEELVPYALGAGEDKTVRVKRRLMDTSARAVEVAVRDGQGQNLYRAETPFLFSMEFKATKFFYPSLHKLRIRLTSPRTLMDRGGLEGATATIRLLRADERDPLREAAADKLEHEQVAELSTEGLAPGDYRVAVVFQGADGREMERQELPLTILAEPEWLGNRVGVDRTVPTPWTPLEVDGQTIRCWGRTYTYEEAFLSTRIVSQGQEVLAAPIRVTGTVDDAPLALGPCDLRFTERADDRVVLEGAGRRDALEVRAKATIEFDGFVWTELTLVPVPSARIGSLALEIPLRVDIATLFQRSLDYLARDTGALKPEGWHGKFQAVWIGHPSAGIQWLAESKEDWHTTRSDREIEVLPQGDQVLLRVNFIDTPVTADKPLTYRFGTIVTPVKPPLKGYRSWRIGWNDSPPTRNIQPYWVFWRYFSHPFPIEGKSEEVAALLKSGLRVLPYIQINNATPYSEEFPYYVSEWSTRTDDTVRFYDGSAGDGGKRWHMSSVCPGAQSWQDYFIYHMAKAIEECDFRGIYHDGPPGGCRNRFHGHTYLEPDGEEKGFQFTLGWREMAKRLYKVVKRHDPDSVIFWHSSGQKDMYVLSFCDVISPGENFVGQLSNRHPDYTHVMPLDKYRTGMMGHNFGPVGAFLTSLSRAPTPWKGDHMGMPAGPAEHILGMAILHDAYLWPGWCHPEPIRRSWDAYDRFGWTDDLEFVPYWEPDAVAQCARVEPDAVKASLFVRPDRSGMMIVLFNDSGEKQEASIRIALERLGALEGADPEDYFHGGRFPWTGDSFLCPMPPHNFRMVAVE